MKFRAAGRDDPYRDFSIGDVAAKLAFWSVQTKLAKQLAKIGSRSQRVEHRFDVEKNHPVVTLFESFLQAIHRGHVFFQSRLDQSLAERGDVIVLGQFSESFEFLASKIWGSGLGISVSKNANGQCEGASLMQIDRLFDLRDQPSSGPDGTGRTSGSETRFLVTADQAGEAVGENRVAISKDRT